MSRTTAAELGKETAMEAAEAVSDAKLAEAAWEILASSSYSGSPMKLSLLGNILSRRFTPWKEILGERHLKTVLERELAGKAVFEGEGAIATVRVGVLGEETRPPRFDRVVWAAFSKPVAAERRRILSVARPFNFVDKRAAELDGDEALESNQREIDPRLIPSEELPSHVRDAKIVQNILDWCNSKQIDFNTLVEVEGSDNRRRYGSLRNDASGGNVGLEALLRLVRTIPGEERRNYSLPLDLIYRLIGGK